MRHTARAWVAPAALLLAAQSCLGLTAPATSSLPFGAPAPGGLHVLFIGNSLTYTNDLPGTLVAIAASGGDTIRTASLAFPNFAIIDHLTSGLAQQAIALDRWQFVVLQQGPTTLGINRDSLVLWTRMYDPLVRAQGAQPALFMTWPDASRLAYLEESRLSYLAAAQAVNGVFLPAGEAWGAAWDSIPSLPLHGGDGFHPSTIGTYLAALVAYERITGHDARLLPVASTINGSNTGVPPGLDSATVRFLQRTSHRVLQRYATP